MWGLIIDQAKFERNSISRAIWFEFLRSLVSDIHCEANNSNWRREERPVALRSIKMLKDLQRHEHNLAQHVAAANARAEVRARVHNWSI